MEEIKGNKKKKLTKRKLNIESIYAEAETALLTTLGEELNIEKEKKSLQLIQTRIIWTGKGSLLLLADVLYKENFIKSKKEFLKFFGDSSERSIIRWNIERKSHLAFLLFTLYKEGYFIVIGNKGYFNYAEHYFTDFNNNIFKKDSLKKLSSRVFLNRERFSYIHKGIHEIILKISDSKMD